MYQARRVNAESPLLEQEQRLTRHVLLAESFAESALYLRGADSRAFVDQFLSLAARPAAVTVSSDGDVFRQALCFPVNGAVQGDLIVPVSNFSPHLVIELRSGHVTGFQPTIRRQHFGRFFWTLPVASHHLRAADAQLADFSNGIALALFVLNTGLRARNRQPNRTVVILEIHWIDTGGRRGLRQAVGFNQCDAGDLFPAFRVHKLIVQGFVKKKLCARPFAFHGRGRNA